MISTLLPACTRQLQLSKTFNMKSQSYRMFYKSSQEQMKDYLTSNIEGFPSRPLNYSQFSNHVGLYITIPQTTLHLVKLTSGLLPYKILTELSRHCLPKSFCFHIQSLNIQQEQDQSSKQSVSVSGMKEHFNARDGLLDYQFRVQVISKNEHHLNNLASKKKPDLESVSEGKEHVIKSPISLALPPVGLHLPGFHLIQTTQPSPLFRSVNDDDDLEESSSVVAEAIFIFTVDMRDELVVRHQIILTYPTFQSTLSLSSA